MQARAILMSPPDRVEVSTVDIPQPANGEYLIEAIYTAVSTGTEVRVLRGQQASLPPSPLIPGYQAVGRVLSAPPGAPIPVGSLVVYPGTQRAEGAAIMWGAHVARGVANGGSVYPLPANVDLVAASLTTIASIAMHGVRLVAVKPGETVAVLGLGLLGQISARLAVLAGAKVLAMDLAESRVALARKAGVQAVAIQGTAKATAKAAGWDDFDVIIDVTGSPRALPSGIELARDLEPWDAPTKDGTRYVVQGSYAGDVAFPYQDAFMKQLTFFFPRDTFKTDKQEVIRLLGAGKLHLRDLAGEPVPVSQAPEIYGELKAANAERLTAVFDWSAS